jgi:hypothetical protein
MLLKSSIAYMSLIHHSPKIHFHRPMQSHRALKYRSIMLHHWAGMRLNSKLVNRLSAVRFGSKNSLILNLFYTGPMMQPSLLLLKSSTAQLSLIHQSPTIGLRRPLRSWRALKYRSIMLHHWAGMRLDSKLVNRLSSVRFGSKNSLILNLFFFIGPMMQPSLLIIKSSTVQLSLIHQSPTIGLRRPLRSWRALKYRSIMLHHWAGMRLDSKLVNRLSSVRFGSKNSLILNLFYTGPMMQPSLLLLKSSTAQLSLIHQSPTIGLRRPLHSWRALKYRSIMLHHWAGMRLDSESLVFC